MNLSEKTKGLSLIRFLQSIDLYPFFRRIDGYEGRHVIHDGVRMVMMGSNNYLGLTHHPEVQKAAQEAIKEWGTGCTGSRFLNGNFSLHENLEKKICDFLGYENALIFPTGYMVNQASISALVSSDDYVFCDRDNHASIIDACQRSSGKIRYYKHSDMTDLEKKLRRASKKSGKLIVTDGVFSMNGEIGKISEIYQLAQKYDARLYVDEAHGIGVTGPGGRGASFSHSVKPEILMGTFSKSLASQGGFVCGSRDVIEWIKQKGKLMMFSAALAPSNVAAATRSLDLLIENPHWVEELSLKAQKLRTTLEDLGFDTIFSQTAIVSVLVKEDKTALALSKKFQKLGVYITPVVYPAVPKGGALVRCSLMRDHTDEDINQVARAFEEHRDFIFQSDQENKLALHALIDEELTEEEISQKADIPGGGHS